MQTSQTKTDKPVRVPAYTPVHRPYRKEQYYTALATARHDDRMHLRDRRGLPNDTPSNWYRTYEGWAHYEGKYYYVVVRAEVYERLESLANPEQQPDALHWHNARYWHAYARAWMDPNIVVLEESQVRDPWLDPDYAEPRQDLYLPDDSYEALRKSFCKVVAQGIYSAIREFVDGSTYELGTELTDVLRAVCVAQFAPSKVAEDAADDAWDTFSSMVIDNRLFVQGDPAEWDAMDWEDAGIPRPAMTIICETCHYRQAVPGSQQCGVCAATPATPATDATEAPAQ